MARTKKIKPEKRRQPHIDWGAIFRSRLFGEAWGILLLVGSSLLLLSLLSHNPSDPTFFGPGRNGHPLGNLVGSVGANLSEGALQFLGFCAYLLPFLLGWSGWKRFWNRAGEGHTFRFSGTLLIVLSTASLLSLLLGERRIGGSPYDAGGWLGELLSSYLRINLGTAGTALVCLAMIGVGILMATRLSLAGLFARLRKLTQETSSAFLVAWVRHREAKRREAMRTEVIQKHARAKVDTPKVDAPKKVIPVPQELAPAAEPPAAKKAEPAM